MNKTFSRAESAARTALLCAALVFPAFLVSCDAASGDLPGPGNIINHTNFSAAAIPDSYLAETKKLDVYFEHASVGINICDALASLAATNSAYTFNRGSWNTNDGTEIAQDIPDWYAANDGFGDNSRGNPGFERKLYGFAERLGQKGLASAIDVASFKFCFIDDDLGSYGTAQDAFTAVAAQMANLEAAYPNVTFVWWTIPVTTSGSGLADAYNALVREYCAVSGKYLIDIADIECHDPEGNRQTAAGSGYETLYASYTDDGGHLNAAGGERVAQAWWAMLARISGWSGL